MAEKRMFSLSVVGTDMFLDMPPSTQCLYFHLNMSADDDGFVDAPNKVRRSAGCSADDLRLLIQKGFIIPIREGLVVMRHWRINNYIRKDRYRETLYVEDKSSLVIGQNGEYERVAESGYPTGIPDGNQPDTQYSVEEKSSEEISLDQCSVDGNTGNTDDVVYSLDNQSLYMSEYNTLAEKYGRAVVDKVIRRILEKPYHNCLKETIISKWCGEELERTGKRRNVHSNFLQRNYTQTEMDNLEKRLLELSAERGQR